MPIFNTAFAATMLPKIVTLSPDECFFSRVHAHFRKPKEYLFDLRAKRKREHHFPHDVELVTEVFVKNEHDTILWTLVTKPAVFKRDHVELELDEDKSLLNGVKNHGRVLLEIREEGIYYALEGHLHEHPKMPLNNGGEPLHIEFRIYHHHHKPVFEERFKHTALHTHLRTYPETDDVAFDLTFAEHRFEGNLVLSDFRRPITAHVFEAKIEFKGHHIEADMRIDAVVDPQGNVSGILLFPSNINDVVITAYITGTWLCNHLFLSIDQGKVAACHFRIPTYTVDVKGTIGVIA